MDEKEKNQVQIVKEILELCSISDNFRKLSDHDKYIVLSAASLTIRSYDLK